MAPWNFYNASGEAMIIDGGVQADSAVFTGNADLGSNLLVGNSGSTGIAISSAGQVNMAAQPSFGAVSRTAQSNCTGNNTLATINFDTELWDIGGNFASHIFTAPVTGKYLLRTQVQVNAVTTSASAINCMLLTSNRNWHIFQSPGIVTSQFTCVAAVVADMDASDTARVQLRINGEGSDIVDIQADAGQPSTSFCGWLLG
jgi:hypothetical protein